MILDCNFDLLDDMILLKKISVWQKETSSFCKLDNNFSKFDGSKARFSVGFIRMIINRNNLDC